MKRLLFLVFILSSLTSFGQFLNYTNINGRYKWIAGKFDSTFTIPVGTTPSLRTGGGNAPGALFYSTTDSTVYQYTGTNWTRLRGSDTAHVISAYVRNTTASAMTPGQVVYINGSTGTTPTIALANNKQDSTSAMTFGFVRGNIPVNGFGYITTFGPLEGVNTNAYTEGEVIYLDSIPGQFTHDKPQAPYHMVTLGYIIKKSGGNGTIYAKIQNGYELDELHNVRITAPVLNKSVIIYDSVRRLWVDTTVSAAGLGLGGSGTTNYVSKWTGTTALGNSLLTDVSNALTYEASSGNASFNLKSPSGHYYPAISLFSNGAFSGSLYSYLSRMYLSANGGGLWFGNATTTHMVLTNSGRVLIGTTTESTFELDVVGDIRSTLDANINGLTVGLGGGNSSGNTALGGSALLSNSTGIVHTAVGFEALRTNTGGIGNTAVGRWAMRNVTVTQSTAIGAGALYNGTGSIFGVTAIGNDAGGAAGGTNSVYLGTEAGKTNNATQNTFIGYQSASQSTVTGRYNVMTGFRSGYVITSGENNTIYGYQQGYELSTGSYNTFIGSGVGGGAASNGISTGSFNTIIGSQVTGLSSSLSNTIILADGQGNQRIVVNSSNQIGLGGQPVAPYPVHINAVSGYGLAVRNSTTTTKLTQVNDGSVVLGDGSGNYSTFEAVGTSGTLRITSPLYQFRSGSNTAIYISSTPNVLIGTTTDAGFKLDVNGTARVSGEITGKDAFTSGGAFALRVNNFVIGSDATAMGSNQWRTTSGNNINQAFIVGGSQVAGINIISNGRFEINGNGGYLFNENGTERLRILSGFTFNIGNNNYDLQYRGQTNSNLLFIDASVDNIGMGTGTPNASALLDVSSTTKGFLPPRMTGAQAEAIGTPAAGLLVYANNGNGTTITSTGWWGYDGTNWVKLN